MTFDGLAREWQSFVILQNTTTLIVKPHFYITYLVMSARPTLLTTLPVILPLYIPVSVRCLPRRIGNQQEKLVRIAFLMSLMVVHFSVRCIFITIRLRHHHLRHPQ